MTLIMGIVPERFHQWCQSHEVELIDEIMLWRAIVLSDIQAQKSWVKMPEEMRWSYARLKYNERKHELFAREN